MILPFNAMSVEQKHQTLAEGIPDILQVCLSSHSKSIKILDRDYMDALIREQGLRYEASMDKETMAHIGRLAAARYILAGNFWVDRKKVEVQTLVYETETTRLVATETLQMPIESLADGCRTYAKRIVEQLDRYGPSSFLDLKADKYPEVNQHMIQGMGFYYNGEYWKAFPEFLKVLKKDPNHGNARYWLGKSYLDAGMVDLARVSLEEFIKKNPKHRNLKEAKKLMKEAYHAKR